jgi:hypothetical protein
MADILLIYLSEDKTCAYMPCSKIIREGEKAIRRQVRETKRSSARIEFYHPECWEKRK